MCSTFPALAINKDYQMVQNYFNLVMLIFTSWESGPGFLWFLREINHNSIMAELMMQVDHNFHRM